MPYSSASPILPCCAKCSVSRLKSEKVVKPPQNPATNSGCWRASLPCGAREAVAANQPMRQEPSTFTNSVPQGKWLPSMAWIMIRAVMGRFLRFNLRATLPHQFREKFDIPWSKGDERRFRIWCGFYRIMHSLTPKKMRLIPMARKAFDDAKAHPDVYQAGVSSR